MLNALIRSNPKPICSVNIGGQDFILEADVEQMRKGITTLRGKYNDTEYGYCYYKKDVDIKLSKTEYLKNIDKFEKEFEKRLEYARVKKVIASAKKKKNGSFHKGRVYNEYVLKNADNTGIGTYRIYKVKYVIVGDNIIRLTFQYTTEAWL